MHQTQGSRCIEEATNLSNTVKMIIGTAKDVANVGGESELRVNRDTQILALLSPSPVASRHLAVAWGSGGWWELAYRDKLKYLSCSRDSFFHL